MSREIDNVPISERIMPTDVCDFCGAPLEAMQEARDEADTVYISCPVKEDETDEHTEHNGVPRANLMAWGWKI